MSNLDPAVCCRKEKKKKEKRKEKAVPNRPRMYWVVPPGDLWASLEVLWINHDYLSDATLEQFWAHFMPVLAS